MIDIANFKEHIKNFLSKMAWPIKNADFLVQFFKKN